MKDEILATLKDIIQSRMDRKIEPSHATFKELKERLNCGEKELTDHLREIRQQGLIDRGRTINDIWIKII